MAKVKKEQLQEEVVDPHKKMGFLLQALYETEGCFDFPTSKPNSATRRATGPMRRSAKFWTEEEEDDCILKYRVLKDGLLLQSSYQVEWASNAEKEMHGQKKRSRFLLTTTKSLVTNGQK